MIVANLYCDMWWICWKEFFKVPQKKKMKKVGLVRNAKSAPTCGGIREAAGHAQNGGRRLVWVEVGQRRRSATVLWAVVTEH